VAVADDRHNAISAASTITQCSHDWVTTSQGDADAGEGGGHHRGEESSQRRAPLARLLGSARLRLGGIKDGHLIPPA
jgi:hypothetical protein